MNYLEKIASASEFLKLKITEKPAVGVVLGTGLGKLIDYIENPITIEYTDIPHFVESTVEFHKGKLVFGKISGKNVVAMQGRFHLYEGYSFEQITFPIRVLKKLGIQKLLLSNAAGGINLDFKKGDLVLINDHINLQGGSPLAGFNSFDYGGIFPDMSAPYNVEISEILKNAAARFDTRIGSGVYASVIGPQLETRAEYRFLKIIGADLVGMSTTPEVIVANQMHLPCAAISVVTDECDPENLKPVYVPEIIAVANAADEKLSKIFAEAIANL